MGGQFKIVREKVFSMDTFFSLHHNLASSASTERHEGEALEGGTGGGGITGRQKHQEKLCSGNIWNKSAGWPGPLLPRLTYQRLREKGGKEEEKEEEEKKTTTLQQV